MELVALFWDFLVHLDRHLAALLQQYGTWIYALLFLIVFCETGLVVTPFLPGDSLLFVAGTLWAAAGMDPRALGITLIAAALCGDNVNYWVGRYLGPKVFRWERSRLFNRAALDYTHAFYERHGGKTIVIARFVPIVRTFAPFVAGIGRMSYARFLAFSVGGAVLWVGSLVTAGYLFGNVPVVKNNLTIVIFAIILASVSPVAIGYLRARARASRAS
ncbi:MAG TPA: DedA family protein [Burkholderiales bacterium]|nr:DedA family protein [Burkholderiales bacterium]